MLGSSPCKMWSQAAPLQNLDARLVCAFALVLKAFACFFCAKTKRNTVCVCGWNAIARQAGPHACTSPAATIRDMCLRSLSLQNCRLPAQIQRQACVRHAWRLARAGLGTLRAYHRYVGNAVGRQRTLGSLFCQNLLLLLAWCGHLSQNSKSFSREKLVRSPQAEQQQRHSFPELAAQ